MKQIEIYLHHILDECNYLLEKSSSTSYDKFVSDPTLTRAFVRSIEVIGEAVKKLPLSFREKHPEIPWKRIAGMRDKLIHDYMGIDYEVVWKTVKSHIPLLKKELEKILTEEFNNGNIHQNG